MRPELTPAKILLLAAHLTAHGDLAKLATLALQNSHVLRRELVLRLLLTYLPETVEPCEYTGFLFDLFDENLHAETADGLDTSFVDILSDDAATKRVKKLQLLPLSIPKDTGDDKDNLICSFLVKRTYKINSEAGVLSKLPELLEPFLDCSPALRDWSATIVVPFVRRNCEYHTTKASEYTLSEFENLSDRTAATYLLSDSAAQDAEAIGRDLRGLVAPWLHSASRWSVSAESHGTVLECPGWEQVQAIIVSWATQSWEATTGAITNWDGPQDVYFGKNLAMKLGEQKKLYLVQSYAKTALACIYSVPDSTAEALAGLYAVCQAVQSRLNFGGPLADIDAVMSNTSLLQWSPDSANIDPKMSALMRRDMLQNSNSLTSATPESLTLATLLTFSAYLATSIGVPWSVRNVGDLLFLGDTREQKGELNKLLRAITAQAPKDSDLYWTRARDRILWLFHWGSPPKKGSIYGCGPLGMISQDFVETEILKTLLSNSKYVLSKTIYDDNNVPSVAKDKLQDAVCHAAMHAFDNASNPNRTRGGLKKCDEIIHCLPNLLDKSSAQVRKVEALLKASHSLSEYRLVLKQGEPFSPIVLRVHSDPVAIIEKVLEQNPKGYTRLQEFLEMGANMVHAGLISSGSLKRTTDQSTGKEDQLFIAEKRIVAMCIEAAIREDDFETAYSYVVSRLGELSRSELDRGTYPPDTWSWAAALKAGQYIRTERSQQPTHLGTASGNLEIRHLEQRIECLATALRAAPPAELQQILKTFRRCEEQLDSAIREEAANEAAWDAAGDFNALPGNFETQVQRPNQPPRNKTASAAARQGEEAPMSLFDLSRATARIAQRNLTALSTLQGIPPLAETANVDQEQTGSRTRKRDQLRDAATGTLVSGVGWLIGANMNGGGSADE